MTKEERIKAAEAYAEARGADKDKKAFRTITNHDLYNHTVESYIKGAEAEAESKWVACSDRMPDRGVCVLVFISNGVITCAHTSVKSNSKTWQLYGDMQSIFDVKYQEVTHWQPLPPPPINQR